MTVPLPHRYRFGHRDPTLLIVTSTLPTVTQPLVALQRDRWVTVGNVEVTISHVDERSVTLGHDAQKR